MENHFKENLLQMEKTLKELIQHVQNIKNNLHQDFDDFEDQSILNPLYIDIALFLTAAQKVHANLIAFNDIEEFTVDNLIEIDQNFNEISYEKLEKILTTAERLYNSLPEQENTTDDFITINIRCFHCKKEHLLEVKEKDLISYKNGKNIADAFPYLTADERELFISQTCSECWDKMFDGEEE